MTGPVIDAPEADETHAATKAAVFVAAERLFALHGFQNVSVRDITAEAKVNLASVNYHFGSKDALLFEIFRRRTAELNRERARMLHEANGRHDGKPPVREILEALFAPPLRWADPAHDRRISVQFIIRARSEGTEQMRDVLQNDVSHLAPLRRCAEGRPARPAARGRLLAAAFLPGHGPQQPVRGVRRLHHLSGGLTREGDVQALLNRMLDFAEAGFRA